MIAFYNELKPQNFGGSPNLNHPTTMQAEMLLIETEIGEELRSGMSVSTLVPRCLTMMAPGLATWSPKILTPSLFPLESRPFLVLPAPFLWAASMVRGKLEGWETESRGGAVDTASSPPLRKEELEDKDSPLKEPMRLRAAVIEEEEVAIWLFRSDCRRIQRRVGALEAENEPRTLIQHRQRIFFFHFPF